MKKRKPKWDMLSDKRRQKCINDIIGFFETERDTKIGVIAAGEVLDFFMEQLAEDIYNNGVEDAKNVFKGKLEDLEIDLEMLGSG
ncbi:DUF2164 family protein [Patescibacteria group bacterium]